MNSSNSDVQQAQILLNKVVDKIEQLRSNDEVLEEISSIVEQPDEHEKRQQLAQIIIDAIPIEPFQREQYDEEWWQKEYDDLQKAFELDPNVGFNKWRQVYANVLMDWKLDLCQSLVNAPFLEQYFNRFRDVTELFRVGTDAIVSGQYSNALPMLTDLAQTQSEEGQFALSEIIRSLLYVFVGRIYLYEIKDNREALKYFVEARNLVQMKDLTPRVGYPYAALGDYYLYLSQEHFLQNDQYQQSHYRRQAAKLYQQAITFSPDYPNGYVGMGLLCEEQAQWDEADDWYRQAIEKVWQEEDIDQALSNLLAPVSGNLYLQLARMLRNENTEIALEAVERALDLKIKHDEPYPERLGYRLKAKILRKLNRVTEAAEAYYRAGQQFGERGELEIAVDLLRQATDLLEQVGELSANHAPIYWYLSDLLRLCSYQLEPPYVDEEIIQASIEAWKQGADLRLPNASDAWSYITRALINEQLARLPIDKRTNSRQELWWEAINYLEQAILLNSTDAYGWNYLGRFHRFLENGANAFYAMQKAYELDPSNTLVLDEKAETLAYLGCFTQAKAAIDQRRELEPDQQATGAEVYILFHTGQCEIALNLLNQIIETDQNDIWARYLRALYYQRLSNETSLNARADYTWVIEHYSPWDIENQEKFGWAAYSLGYLDKAINIFEKLRNDGEYQKSIHSVLGLLYLAKGDYEVAKATLKHGIAVINNKRVLNDFLEIELTIIERDSEHWDHGAESREILEQAKERIEERIAALDQPINPKDELQQIIQTASSESWAQLGAQAGLQRFFTSENIDNIHF
ncbi:MAG: hypothetical protein HC833_15795 [Leptolyngbyaceae cyanobacterium RM1_406_9]|nr:hypothetical protein [Leptolyngbyaceae cyanobacterium RM1_406_9]